MLLLQAVKQANCHATALASVIHPFTCVSNTSLLLSRSLTLPHLLGLNELRGLIMILWTAVNSTEQFASLPCVLGGPTKNRRSYAVSSHYREQSADVDLSAILSPTINKNTEMSAQFEKTRLLWMSFP